MHGATVTKQIHFSMRQRGQREIHEGPKPVPEITGDGRVPRLARLMALAIKLDGLIASGGVYAASWLGLLSTQADASSLVAGLAASMGVAVGFGFVAGHRRTRMTRSSR